jgi:HK97 gp10 family phage protein
VITSLKVDVSEAVAGLDVVEKIKHKLARSMAVAGGSEIRDEAKRRAPVGQDSKNPGELEEAIYLAYRDRQSTDTEVRYSVSWNATKAPHGHLAEFGYWQPFVVFPTADGWRTLASGDGRRGGKGVRLKAGPKWIPPSPFLRPAYEATLPRLQQIMIERARERLPELLKGVA